jgi:starch-binding outer membrane protein, SusD/RagB family
MKKYIYLAIIVLSLGACNEDTFLKETPLDFMSASNAYSTSSDFDQAVNELYYLTRYEFYCNQERSAQDYFMGTDLFANGSSGNSNPNLASAYGASSTIAQAHWDKLYLLIAQANTIISRLPSSEVTASDQVLFVAKAKFFRGLAYRTLAYLYGGVPLQLEEVTTPKTDYVRATKDSTITQAISDVKYAAENLENIDEVEDGEVNSAAAYHLLSELYLADGQYQNAVDAATKVIDNDCGTVALMTSRFGSRSTETPGDVFWDLYRMDNQNRSTYGNTEGLYVIQMEYTGTTAGGTDLTSLWTSPGSYLLERMCAPQTGLFRMIYHTSATDSTIYSPFTWPIGDYTGGRGIGSCVPTNHFDKEIWGGYGSTEFNSDIRNANHNIVRKFKFNNTNATTLSAIVKAFGSDTIDIDKYDEYKAAGWTFVSGDNNVISTFPARYLLCYQTKCTGLYDYPSTLLSNTTTYQLASAAGGTYSDQYMFRLAETYLLRAEAYVRLSDFTKAAADINVVRSRAKAASVTTTELNTTGVSGVAGLDYILDERMRELGMEEKRRLTLGRLGADIFYNRVTTYNPYYSGTYGNRSTNPTFLSTYTLYAIPQTAIDANKDAVLTQNDGY